MDLIISHSAGFPFHNFFGIISLFLSMLEVVQKTVDKFMTEGCFDIHTDAQGRSQPLTLNSSIKGKEHKRKKNVEFTKMVIEFADNEKCPLKQIFQLQKSAIINNSQ